MTVEKKKKPIEIRVWETPHSRMDFVDTFQIIKYNKILIVKKQERETSRIKERTIKNKTWEGTREKSHGESASNTKIYGYSLVLLLRGLLSD